MPTRGFDYQDGRYHCEQVDLARVAEQCGTPCYVYSASSIVENYRAYHGALAAIPHEIHYAVKANSSIGLLALLARDGAGFDIVSGGELFRVLKAGGDATKVVFSGVGKSAGEIRYALESGIGWFNCESEAELGMVDEIAGEFGLRPSVALRVNPDINADTHPYIATGLHAHKFGIELCEAERIYALAAKMANVDPNGVSCHIGSQIFDTGVFYEALDRVVELAARLRQTGLNIRNLDLGGGLAVGYRASEPTPSIADYAARLAEALKGAQLKLMLEPGRSIVGQAGVLLTKVLYRKRTGSKEFVIIDAAMNDLIRPALYQAHHEIVPLEQREALLIEADVVGPVCETGDFLARGRKMPDCAPGEVLAVCTTGAYGFVQASNYNSRPRAPEILVEGDTFKVIRKRESYEDLVRGETAIQ